MSVPYERAFAYIADPANLTQWASAFESVRDGSAVLHTPAGTAEIGLRVAASPENGTIDWILTFGDGSTATACSRLTRGAAERIVYSFVLNAPPVALEQIEGALGAQSRILEEELARLASILEG